MGTPQCLPHVILGNVAKHYGIWVSPPRCGLTNKVKLLPSRHTTYVGGNKRGYIPIEKNQYLIAIQSFSVGSCSIGRNTGN